MCTDALQSPGTFDEIADAISGKKCILFLGAAVHCGPPKEPADEYYPLPETFVFNFKRWPTLFVGYSLMDYNLRLLFKTLRWRIIRSAPPTFSVDRSPDPLIYEVWHNQRRYVNYLVQDIWSFVPELHLRLFGEPMPQ